MSNINRRAALNLLTASAAAAVTGCCWRGYAKPSSTVSADLVGASALPGFKLDRSGIFQGLSAIDAHAHFFNASDVPVRGFVAESIGHSASPYLRPLVAAFALIAEQIAKAAPTASEELVALQSLAMRIGAADAQSREGLETTFFASARRDAANRLADVLKGTKLLAQLRRTTVARASIGALDLGDRGPVTAEQILAVVEASESATDQSRQAMGIATDDSQRADAAGGFLAFLYYMLSFRLSNLKTYRTVYGGSARSVRVEQVMGALVDFDRWIDCPPYSAHADQLQLHEQMARLSNGYLKPLVAYNPWTDIIEEGAGLARVKRALQSKQFVGVKIYPPMGFFPAGNTRISVKSRKERPNLDQLDRVLSAFFEDPDVRAATVMAHSSHSNGRDDAHDDFGGPLGWSQLLAEKANISQLPKINFAHFGGACGPGWGEEFAKLMQQYPSRGLYGDLGFWNETKCNGGQLTPGERLRRVVTLSVGNETVGDRIMFGTDWHMLSIEPAWSSYPDRVATMIRQIGDETLAQKIFGGNARHCFDLVS